MILNFPGKINESKQIVASRRPFYGLIRQIEGRIKVDPMLAQGIRGLVPNSLTVGFPFFMYLEQVPRYICSSPVVNISYLKDGTIQIQTHNSVYVIENPELGTPIEN